MSKKHEIDTSWINGHELRFFSDAEKDIALDTYIGLSQLSVGHRLQLLYVLKNSILNQYKDVYKIDCEKSNVTSILPNLTEYNDNIPF